MRNPEPEGLPACTMHSETFLKGVGKSPPTSCEPVTDQQEKGFLWCTVRGEVKQASQLLAISLFKFRREKSLFHQICSIYKGDQHVRLWPNSRKTGP